MKQILYTVTLVLTAAIAFGQNSRQVADDLKATKTETSLVLTWTAPKQTEAGSWQVEASENGQEFTSIGLVWGADPKLEGTSYSFKQKHEKLRPGYRFYRVQFIGTQAELSTSKTIGLTK